MPGADCLDWEHRTGLGGAIVEVLGAAIVTKEDTEVGACVVDAESGFGAASRKSDVVGNPVVGCIISRRPVEFYAHAPFTENGGGAITRGPVPPVTKIGGVMESDPGFPGDEHVELVARDAVLDHGRAQLHGIAQQPAATTGLVRSVKTARVRRIKVVRKQRCPSGSLPQRLHFVSGQHTIQPD